MNTLASQLVNAVSAERLQQRLFAMVSIPSPTGNARAVAEYYAALLSEIGLPAQLRPLAGHRQSPGVVARWKGASTGPTLQYAGHMDTIHTPHAAPHMEGTHVYGRGTADMKSGLPAPAIDVELAFPGFVPSSGIEIGCVLTVGNRLEAEARGSAATARCSSTRRRRTTSC